MAAASEKRRSHVIGVLSGETVSCPGWSRNDFSRRAAPLALAPPNVDASSDPAKVSKVGDHVESLLLVVLELQRGIPHMQSAAVVGC